MNFEYDSLRFDSFPGEEFRLTFHPVDKKNTHMLWMEGKRGKGQWSAEISEDVSKYGPAGVPKDALFAFLRTALKAHETATIADDCAAGAEKGPMVTIKCTLDQCNKSIGLELTVKISEAWSNVYTMILAPKEVSKAEVMAAKLRDAEEEIIRLRTEVGRLMDRPIVKVNGKRWMDTPSGYPTVEWGANQIVMFGDATFQYFRFDSTKLYVLRGGICKLTFDVIQFHLQAHGGNHQGSVCPDGIVFHLEVHHEGTVVAEFRISSTFYTTVVTVPARSCITLSNKSPAIGRATCGHPAHRCNELPSILLEYVN